MAATASIGENLLVGQIATDFLPRFAPDGILRYVAGEDWARQYPDLIDDLGLSAKQRRHLPDVLIHQPTSKRLILIDASTSQGVMTTSRRNELSRMYVGSTAKLIFVTAFPSRKAMSDCFEEIAWETEVWVADEPDHLIHFNGDNFLGPYNDGVAAMAEQRS